MSPVTLLASTFEQINLVSNIPNVAANTDPNLVNPWGMSFSATSPFWISDDGSNVSTLYNGSGTPNALVVSVPGAPTGQVFNSTTGFVLPDGKAASFIFDTEAGTIAAWNSGAGTAAVTLVSSPGASYTGLALGTSGGNSYLYAADVTGSIHVFNSSFQSVALSGNFTDPNAIAGYVPFNIQLIGSSLYVTYAKMDAMGNPLPGGYIDIFNTDGTFAQRFTTGGPLDAPWGITLAPSTFGSFGNDILVGNFGTGEIAGYTTTGAFVGLITGLDGMPIVNDGLWALSFRIGGTNVKTNALYFTAGLNNEADGLFGEISQTPEPSPLILTGLGLTTFALFSFRKHSQLRA